MEAAGDRLRRDVLLHDVLDMGLEFFPALFHVVVSNIVQEFVTEVPCGGAHGFPVRSGPEWDPVGGSFVDLGAQVEVSHDDSVMVGDSGDGFYAFKQ